MAIRHCSECGTECSDKYHSSFQKRGGEYSEYYCKSCWDKKCAQTRKAWGCLFSAIWWPIKTLGKVVCKLITNKWVWTIFSCGLAWAAWKALDKIYAPKN